jgi:mitochondrial import receptor subunit TOM70
MSNQPYPVPPGGVPVQLATPSQSSLWDRISSWASENKVAVYTIAGVAIVVTGAGVAYYLTDSVRLNNVFYLAIRPC